MRELAELERRVRQLEARLARATSTEVSATGVTAAELADALETTWSVLPLAGDWVRALSTLQGPLVGIGPGKLVQLAGWVSTAGGASNVIATLPVGRRPAERLSCPSWCFVGTNQACRVDVLADGTVRLISPAVAAAAEVCLNGVRFVAL